MAKQRIFCPRCGLPLGPKGHPKRGGCLPKEERQGVINKIKKTDPKLAAEAQIRVRT